MAALIHAKDSPSIVESLPPEIIDIITSNVPQKDLLSLARCCKTFHQAARPHIWMKLHKPLRWNNKQNSVWQSWFRLLGNRKAARFAYIRAVDLECDCLHPLECSGRIDHREASLLVDRLLGQLIISHVREFICPPCVLTPRVYWNILTISRLQSTVLPLFIGDGDDQEMEQVARAVARQMSHWKDPGFDIPPFYPIHESSVQSMRRDPQLFNDRATLSFTELVARNLSDCSKLSITIPADVSELAFFNNVLRVGGLRKLRELSIIGSAFIQSEGEILMHADLIGCANFPIALNLTSLYLANVSVLPDQVDNAACLRSLRSLTLRNVDNLVELLTAIHLSLHTQGAIWQLQNLTIHDDQVTFRVQILTEAIGKVMSRIAHLLHFDLFLHISPSHNRRPLNLGSPNFISSLKLIDDYSCRFEWMTIPGQIVLEPSEFFTLVKHAVMYRLSCAFPWGEGSRLKIAVYGLAAARSPFLRELNILVNQPDVQCLTRDGISFPMQLQLLSYERSLFSTTSRERSRKPIRVFYDGREVSSVEEWESKTEVERLQLVKTVHQWYHDYLKESHEPNHWR